MRAWTSGFKTLLIAQGLWSPYLEVGIGPDAEIFSKSQPMSAVGLGADVGIHPMSSWNNPEPEVVVVEQSLPVKTKTQLTAMGYTLKVVPDLGAVSAIRISAGSLHGAFDPRKGGGAVGD